MGLIVNADCLAIYTLISPFLYRLSVLPSRTPFSRHEERLGQNSDNRKLDVLRCLTTSKDRVLILLLLYRKKLHVPFLLHLPVLRSLARLREFTDFHFQLSRYFKLLPRFERKNRYKSVPQLLRLLFLCTSTKFYATSHASPSRLDGREVKGPYEVQRGTYLPGSETHPSPKL
jgi:hypothetical protein